MAYIFSMRFVRTRRYVKDLRRIGATEAEADAIERTIAADPTSGAVISGLRGVRKLRFALRNRGKHGGGRAIYFLMVADDTAVLIMAFTKNEQADLGPEQRRAVLGILKELEDD